jgi:type II secretory pathway pseudopilin PulG
VELLVVIVIIGMLASLITVAGMNAILAAKQAAQKIELDNLSLAMNAYKTDHGSIPPVVVYVNGATPVSNAEEFRRHFKKIHARHREDAVITALLAANPTPGELLCLYLRGFSPDASYPLTGAGTRTKIFDFDETRFKPTRVVTAADGRSLQLMEYYPKDATQPYLYFDTSRTVPGASAAIPVYSSGAVTVVPYLERIPGGPPGGNRMVNPDSFQILSPGLDGEYGPNILAISPTPLVPTGPFTGLHADNLANFSEKNMEDSEP